MRAVRPEAPILVDPVTGDEEGRYVPDAVAEAIRAELLPRADIATPNANELADLANGGDVIAAARRLGPGRVIVTSAPNAAAGTGAMLVTADAAVLAEHEAVTLAPRGTGDLFSAVYLSTVLSGAGDREALRNAASATLCAIKASTGDLLAFPEAQDDIAAPPADLRHPARSVSAPARVHGVDGCRGGWAVMDIALSGDPEPRLAFVPDLAPLVGRGEVIAIDIPIGLPDRIDGTGRPAEQAVRKKLGPRQSSVFSIPSRRAVHALDYPAACATALETSDPPKKVSRQAFNIFPLIRAVDAILTPQNQAHVFESHAEVAFWRLNGETPMPTAKKVKGVPVREGLLERIGPARRHGIPRAVFDALPLGVPLIDAVDAAALALIARRCAAGIAVPFPDPPAVDARGLRSAIWA